MKRKDFPLVLSPNLGCPQIVSLQDDPSFPLIVAVQLDQAGARPGATVFENRFRLIPSVPGEGLETGLAITQAPSEITDWNQLSGFSDLEDTRNLINRELHYQVLGEGTQYWRVTVSMERDHLGDLLRRKGQATLPTLYDLVTQLDGDRSQRVNHHAVQLVQAIEPRNCVFLHLSDAHVEKRNDEMLDEVLKEHNERDAALIRRDYINFNQNFREAIRVANQRADRGEIEFVLLTGDLVDQAFQGWAEETNPDENNFKKFIDIVVGRGREHSTWGNPGLKVALFTSTGNHDWRLHPYDPASLGRAETFGLKPEEAQRFPYRSFEAADHPEDERSRMAEELASGTLNAST